MDKVATMIDEARPVIGDVRATLAMAKKHLGERGRVGVILRNVEALTNVARREAPEIISKVKTIADKGSVVMDKAGTLADKAVAFADDGRALVADVRGLLGAQSGKITKIVDRVLGIGDQASKVMSLVHAMVARIARGEGSIGALLKDDELYDNIREIMRDLKQHPWKVLWKD
jgi:hypothetical protein